MQKHANKAVAIVAGLIFFGCHSTELTAQQAPATADDANALHSSKLAPKTHFLVVGKGLVADPTWRQEIAADAVRKIADSARKAMSGIMVDALFETVMTKEQYLRGERMEKVTGPIFTDRLRQLAESATPQDTVVIYTHSHGRKNGFEQSQPLGGIVMDLPVRQPEHRGTLLWNEYADLLLKIPAKNVVVLTMSCFSGGLIEYLETPQVRARWNDRRPRQGRNLIVLTSQSKDLPSNPIMKDGEVINPFTYAVVKAFVGEADGFSLVRGKPSEPRQRDGRLTAGEMIDYILYTTENTTSDRAQLKNTAKPQLTGSFNRTDVLFTTSKVATDDHGDGNTAQQDAAADADKPRR